MSDDAKKPYETRDVWLTRGEGDGWIGISPLVHPKCTKCGTTLRPTLTFSTDNGVVDHRNWCVDCTRVALVDMAALVYERDEARKVANNAVAEINALTAARCECEQAGNEMPIDAVRRFVSSKTAIVDMLQDRLSESRSEVERLTDERDELLVRVAEQDAELRATREAYIDAKWTNAYRRGAEAMREACARVADAHCVPGTRDVIRALSIPEDS
jgi:hypothetical protein